MTILTMPALLATEMEWRQIANTQTFASPLTGATKRAEMAGARWAATLMLNNRSEAQYRAWMVFLAKLRGAAGSCYLSPASAFPLTGAGGGTPLVKGAGQTGTTLLIDGCTPNVTGWIKAGDYFHFDTTAGRELKLCTVDANSNGSGEVTITFEPPTRTAPADNAAIEITAPFATMRLVDDNQAAFKIRPGRFGDTTLQFIEVFPS